MKLKSSTEFSTGYLHRLNRVGCLLLIGTLLVLSPNASLSQDEEKKKGGGNRGGNGKPNSKNTDTWSAEEYSGLRGEKNLRDAMASKGFAWLSGSPADNEKLSVGKNAQFFGFVALRYQSGRAANRGMLGRAMFAIADEAQRARMAEAVVAEKEALEEWWVAREKILTRLEDHLYTGLPIDRDQLAALGVEFSHLGTQVALHEATAFADFEDAMTSKQEGLMKAWRENPEGAGEYGRDNRVTADGFERQDQKQLEDLYAKAFSWLTGTPKDNEIIPIGQPAQFFGFVAIRHKSGHAASRGTISKDFFQMLNEEQQLIIEKAVDEQIPVVREFLENRHEFLNQLALLRSDPASFDRGKIDHFSAEMGRLEMDAAVIEAQDYRAIRASMSEDQVASLMKMRGDYVLDETQVATMDMEQRGAALSILCSGCHGAPGQHRPGMPAPSLDGFWDRPIAGGTHFEYSDALKSVGRKQGGKWTPELLDQFIANPKKFAVGTKMEFQGLLNTEDRQALVEHLRRTR